MTKTDITPINKIEDTVVLCVTNPLICSDCGTELHPGDLVSKQSCLKCEKLDHLVFLKSGNVALTRRSKEHSKTFAVVKKFSKSRKRNETQGYLVELEALVIAERECEADEQKREIAREKAIIKHAKVEIKYVAKFLQQILNQYPSCPVEDAESIAEYACEKYSGRVGRSASAKKLNEYPVTLAVRAHIRHTYTKYDNLLTEGWDKSDARDAIVGDVDRVEIKWKERNQFKGKFQNKVASQIIS